MRRAAVLAIAALTLSGCSDWNWRQTGRLFVQAACSAYGECELSCPNGTSSNPGAGCQGEARSPN